MSTISSQIKNVDNFDQVAYDKLLENAKTSHVSKQVIDNNLLIALQKGDDFNTAINNVNKSLPSLSQPDSLALSNIALLGAVPSPAGLFAIILVDNAAEQKKANRELIYATGELAVEKTLEQAAEIKREAFKQVIMNVVAGGLTIGAGATSGLLAAFNPMGLGDMARSTVASGAGQAVGGIGQMITAGATYSNSMSQARVKTMEAEGERARNERDQLRAFTDTMSETISKVLQGQDNLQQLTNQTRTKILAK